MIIMEECGCGINDLAPCEAINLDDCEPAKLKADNLFYPMEEAESIWKIE